MFNKSITLEGITYNSLSEARDYYGISKPKYQHRVNAGWTVEETFGITPRQTINNNRSDVGTIYVIRNFMNERVYVGVTFGPVNKRFNNHKKYPVGKMKKLIEKYGTEDLYISVVDVVSREEACARESYFINKFDSINNGYNSINSGYGNYVPYHGIEYNGEIFTNVQELSKHLGMSAFAIRERIKKKIPLDTPLRDCSIVADGVKYKSIYEAGKKLGLSQTEAKRRFKLTGSFKEPKSKLLYKYKGKEYRPAELAKLLKTNESSFYRKVTKKGGITIKGRFIKIQKIKQ